MKHFFTPRPLDSKDLSIRGIGIREKMPPCLIERPRGTGDYLLMLFHDKAVAGFQSLAGPLQDCETMMIWPPGKGQFYGNATTSFTHTWIHCQGQRVTRMIKEAGLPFLRPFPVSSPVPFEQGLLEMHRELVSHARPDPAIAGNLLENALRRISREGSTDSKNNVVPGKMLAVRELISTAPARHLPLDEMARLAGMSTPYFCASFKKVFGIAPVDCLIRHRMHHAAHLLANRQLSITEVASQCGYGDLFHFSKTFKRHFGRSPRLFRLKNT